MDAQRYCHKSLLTNLIAVMIVTISYCDSPFQAQLRSIGLFALSGALTNWLAVHMLFEKIPGLYGSGIIPNRFEEFKTAIEQLIMQQFFTAENISRFVSQTEEALEFDPSPLVKSLDYELLFQKLIQAIEATPLAPLLAMGGGPAMLEPMKPTLFAKLEEALIEMASSSEFKASLKTALHSSHLASDQLIGKVQHIVHQRLEELTPQIVKEIIQDMIRTHLGWLVVWGGVFGGLIGLLSSFI